jgi:hypothetical protein
MSGVYIAMLNDAPAVAKDEFRCMNSVGSFTMGRFKNRPSAGMESCTMKPSFLLRREFTRREFTVMAAGAAAAARYGIAPLAAQSKASLTAQNILDRIHQQAGAGWPRNASAGLKAGSADTPVRGIVTTSMATVDVLRQAIKSGANLIFTCEPTYFGVNDGAPPAPRPQQAGAGGPQGGPPRQQGISPTDPIFLAKKAIIEQNNLVVFRIGDHWTTGEDLSLLSPQPWAGQGTAPRTIRCVTPSPPARLGRYSRTFIKN